MNKQNHSLTLDEKLHARLGDLADKAGISIDEHAVNVLRSHADEQDRLALEYAEDDKRWENYRAMGNAIPVREIKQKLQHLAAGVPTEE